MELNYWNGEGKYQQRVNKLSESMPDIGYTDNKYANLLIISKNLYHDIYNNGGCNIKDFYLKDIEKYVIPFNNKIKTMNFKVLPNTLIRYLKNETKLENLLNEIIELLNNKDLNYSKYILYQQFEDKKLSKSYHKDFEKIVFGIKKDYEEWINIRLSETWNFKMI